MSSVLMALVLFLIITFTILVISAKAPLPVQSIGSIFSTPPDTLPLGQSVTNFTNSRIISGTAISTTIPDITVIAATPTPRIKTKDSAPCYVGQIKGNSESKFYHEPSWYWYSRFSANDKRIVCFDNITQAEAAGYKPGLHPTITPTPRK